MIKTQPSSDAAPASQHVVDVIKVMPGEQTRISLGSFSSENPPRGFSTHLNPDPGDDDTITTHISRLDRGDGTYKLILHIANFGDKAVSAGVQQL